jgi:hypothetical protein
MRALILGAVLSLGLATGAMAAAPEVTAVPGKPNLGLASYDLATVGYVVEEFFLKGEAQGYRKVGEAGPDGKWQAAPAETAPYATRIVVVRPADPKKFNGTAAVEWLNVTGGIDVGPDWQYGHREMMRSGYAWVGVSVQKVGVEGGPSMAGPAGAGALKKANPQRYGALSHPGDAYAFDIYSQAGRVVRDGRVLGPLKAKRLLALGESQSAIFMTTYINAIDPLAKVYDGYFVHSRFGGAPGVDASRTAPQTAQPGIRFRPDRRVPVMTVLAETDVTSPGGWWTAQQPDDAKLRVWQIAGAAHADTYMLQVAASDSGLAPVEKLAPLWKPTTMTIMGRMAKPINSAPQHHYVVQAALAGLDTWVRTGKAPPRATHLETILGADGAPPSLVLDANGNARGGVRSPWVDVPTAKLSGFGNEGGPFARLLGSTEPYDAATLKRLYPGGKADYLKAFEASLARTVKAGFILPADQAEIRALAAALYPEG